MRCSVHSTGGRVDIFSQTRPRLGAYFYSSHRYLTDALQFPRRRLIVYVIGHLSWKWKRKPLYTTVRTRASVVPCARSRIRQTAIYIHKYYVSGPGHCRYDVGGAWKVGTRSIVFTNKRKALVTCKLYDTSILDDSDWVYERWEIYTDLNRKAAA